jgi:integrase
MRCSEICGLELKNIDLEHSSIKIEKQLCYEVDRNTGKNKYIFKDLKTESSKRTIFITGKAKEAIEKQMNIREKYKSNEEDFSDLLFYSNSGTPLHVNMIDAHLNRVYNRLKDDLSVSRLSCHMFRHTFATYCLELGIHPRVIQEALGHKYDRITQIYAQVTETMKASSLSKLDNLYDIK